MYILYGHNNRYCGQLKDYNTIFSRPFVKLITMFTIVFLRTFIESLEKPFLVVFALKIHISKNSLTHIH